jgi:hypothetical protein
MCTVFDVSKSEYPNMNKPPHSAAVVNAEAVTEQIMKRIRDNWSKQEKSNG